MESGHSGKKIKQFWPDTLHYSLGPPNSCGVATLLKHTVKNISVNHKDNAGRLLITEHSFKHQKIRIINVYAPNNEQCRKDLFLELKKWCINNCIIVGDLNVTLTNYDISSNNVFEGDMSRATLFDLLNTFNMVDVWCVLHPGERGYFRKQIV